MKQPEHTNPPQSAVVVGGGIAGLAAARNLAMAGVSQVTLLEASDRLGGKLWTVTVDGVGLELGADSFLAMKPQAVALSKELGLDLVGTGPLASRTYLLREGRLRPLPQGLAMGVPTGIGPLIGCVRDGIIGPLGAMRAGLEPLLPRGADRRSATVEAVMRARLGRQVADRLIAPLVGGVFGAPPNEVGFDDVFPHLATTRSLVLAMARRPKGPGGPAFMTPREGLQRMVDALTDDLAKRGVTLATGVPATRVAKEPDVISVDTEGETYSADAVIIATPAHIAARLLATTVPTATERDLAAVTSHPSAVFLLRYPKGTIGRDLDGGGYLVDPSERRTVAACTWLPSKWPHHPWGDPWIRAIVTDPAALAQEDGALSEAVAAEIGATLGAPDPADIKLHRWPEAIPIYSPGHRVRMNEILQSVPEGVALAGASYAGPGIPDCIESAHTASLRVQHMTKKAL